MKRLSRTFAAVLVVFGFTPAAAAVSAETAEISPVGHCMQVGERTGRIVSGAIELSIANVRCFDGYASLYRYVTGKPTTAVAPTAQTTADVNEALIAQGESLTAIGYDYKDFGGPSINFIVPSASGCLGGTSWGWSRITDSWNNRISSMRTGYTYCDFAQLFDYANYGGALFPCANCASLGAMNNAATSLKVFD